MMDNNSSFLVEFVVTIEQAYKYNICKMICRRVASLTCYVCVDIMVNWDPIISHQVTISYY
jgi:hypothetical protein